MSSTGADVCAYSTLPTNTWTSPSCKSSSPTPPLPSGQYIFTSTKGPEPGNENTVLYGCTATTTTLNYVTLCADPTPTPLSTILPKVPTAVCNFWDQAVMWKVGIVNVTNWVEKDRIPWTTALFNSIQYNCGAVTRWKTGRDNGGEWVYFDTPMCVPADIDKSIKPAGGPDKVYCNGHPL